MPNDSKTKNPTPASFPQITAVEFTHIGQRAENQDSHTLLHAKDALLAVVADGMGGHAGGALAAQAATACAEAKWAERPSKEEPEAFLRRLLRAAHYAVVKASTDAGLGLDPGATFAALLIQQTPKGLVAQSIHAGDARIIQYSDQALVKQSTDHSMAQLHVMRGLITQEEAATHPDQRWVLAHIGGDAPPEGEVTDWSLAEGHRFAVCSDGFWEIFPPPEVLALFKAAKDQPALASSLAAAFVKKLPAHPTQDNTTVLLLDLEAAT